MIHIIVFIFCMLTWVVLSGMLDPFHLGLGVLSSVLTTFLTAGMLFNSPHKSYSTRLREAVLVPLYALWLLKEIVLANIYLLYLAFHPNLKEKLNPRILSVKSEKLNDRFSRYVMGISITLVPGTVTVAIEPEDSEFIVHAISDHAAAGLPEPMESKIAHIFCRAQEKK